MKKLIMYGTIIILIVTIVAVAYTLNATEPPTDWISPEPTGYYEFNDLIAQTLSYNQPMVLESIIVNFVECNGQNIEWRLNLDGDTIISDTFVAPVGGNHSFQLDTGLQVEAGEVYWLIFEVKSGGSAKISYSMVDYENGYAFDWTTMWEELDYDLFMNIDITIPQVPADFTYDTDSSSGADLIPVSTRIWENMKLYTFDYGSVQVIEEIEGTLEIPNWIGGVDLCFYVHNDIDPPVPGNSELWENRVGYGGMGPRGFHEVFNQPEYRRTGRYLSLGMFYGASQWFIVSGDINVQ